MIDEFFKKEPAILQYAAVCLVLNTVVIGNFGINPKSILDVFYYLSFCSLGLTFVLRLFFEHEQRKQNEAAKQLQYKGIAASKFQGVLHGGDFQQLIAQLALVPTSDKPNLYRANASDIFERPNFLPAQFVLLVNGRYRLFKQTFIKKIDDSIEWIDYQEESSQANAMAIRIFRRNRPTIFLAS